MLAQFELCDGLQPVLAASVGQTIVFCGLQWMSLRPMNGDEKPASVRDTD
jgi:hypothetical protein